MNAECSRCPSFLKEARKYINHFFTLDAAAQKVKNLYMNPFLKKLGCCMPKKQKKSLYFEFNGSNMSQ